MIHVDALDFSEWHSEEVMFLLTLSVDTTCWKYILIEYIGPTKAFDLMTLLFATRLKILQIWIVIQMLSKMKKSDIT